MREQSRGGHTPGKSSVESRGIGMEREWTPRGGGGFNRQAEGTDKGEGRGGVGDRLSQYTVQCVCTYILSSNLLYPT
jgi:hypothetical protein